MPDNAITKFELNGDVVRVIQADGTECFVARDLATAVGAGWDGAKTIEHVPDKWKLVVPIPTTHGLRDVLCLTEQGVNFYLIRSDKPKALPIQEWIAGEVIPSVRKTGQYGAPPVQTPDPTDPRTMLAYSKLMTAALEAKIQEVELLQIENQRSEEKNALLTATVEAQTEDIEAFKQICGKEGWCSVDDAARVLEMRSSVLRNWLVVNRIFFQDGGYKPYAQYRERGFFKLGAKELSDRTVYWPLVSVEGLRFMAKRLMRERKKNAAATMSDLTQALLDFNLPEREN